MTDAQTALARVGNALVTCGPIAPSDIAAILAHVDAQEAEIEELRERCHEYAMALADKEQR